MENVTTAPTEFTSARPPGSVLVDKTVQDATVYGTPSGNRPVEATDIFFKEHIGTITTSATDLRGTLLLTIDLDFNHGEVLRSRKTNYAYNQYAELRLEGKRTDVIFGRSGSVGMAFTTNPWYKLSATDAAANAVALQSDPTFRVITMSDMVDVDLNHFVKDMIRANSWYFANPSPTMPDDYYIAGRIFIVTEIPPQLLSYQMPLYIAGTVKVRDYIPTALASLTYSKQRVDATPSVTDLDWDANLNEYVINVYCNDVIEDTEAVGDFVPDVALTKTVTIRQTPEPGEEPERFLDAPTEVHMINDFPCKVTANDAGTTFTFRTTITKLTNFTEPEIVETNIPDLHGYVVFEDNTPIQYKTYAGKSLDSIPVRSVKMPKAVINRIVGPQLLHNMQRVRRQLPPVVTTRPAGQDVLNLANLMQAGRV